MGLENQIDQFLGQIMEFSENQHEILLGACESSMKLTTTQEHILMLLSEKKGTNAKIAQKLKISPAAVTKALKKLQEKELIESSRDQKDERVVFWSLAEKGKPIAQEHASHHEKTLAKYKQIVEKFTAEERKTIKRFLTDLGEELQ